MGNAGAVIRETGERTYNTIVKSEKPEAPILPPPPPAPSPISEDPAAKKELADKQEEAARVERKSRGRASTVLTRAGGLGTQEAPLSRRMLLGS